jgi:hypothetical protein
MPEHLAVLLAMESLLHGRKKTYHEILYLCNMQRHLSPFVGILVFEVEKIIQTQAIVIYLHLGRVHQSAKEYS